MEAERTGKLLPKLLEEHLNSEHNTLRSLTTVICKLSCQSNPLAHFKEWVFFCRVLLTNTFTPLLSPGTCTIIQEKQK